MAHIVGPRGPVPPLVCDVRVWVGGCWCPRGRGAAAELGAHGAKGGSPLPGEAAEGQEASAEASRARSQGLSSLCPEARTAGTAPRKTPNSSEFRCTAVSRGKSKHTR